MKNINSYLLLVLSVSELEFRFTCTAVTDWCFLFVCVVIFRWLICYLNGKSVFSYSVFVCFFSLCCVTHEFFDNFALNLFIRLFWNCCLEILWFLWNEIKKIPNNLFHFSSHTVGYRRLLCWLSATHYQYQYRITIITEVERIMWCIVEFLFLLVFAFV